MFIMKVSPVGPIHRGGLISSPALCRGPGGRGALPSNYSAPMNIALLKAKPSIFQPIQEDIYRYTSIVEYFG